MKWYVLTIRGAQVARDHNKVTSLETSGLDEMQFQSLFITQLGHRQCLETIAFILNA